MGRLSAFCIQAKLGSPMQDFHLQGGTCLPEISKEEFTSIVNYFKSMQPLEKGHVLTGNLERRVYVVRYSAGMELPGDGGYA